MSFPLPFASDTALATVRSLEGAYNDRNPDPFLSLCTIDCQWRVRAEFIWGRDQIQNFLARKWRRELEYRAIGELFSFGDDRISVRFVYEYRDDSGQWFRAYGNDNLTFAASGLINRRMASVNEHQIERSGRRLLWPSGQRPKDDRASIDLDFASYP